MTDSNATKLLKKLLFDVQRLEYEADKPGSDMTLGEYEEKEAELISECAQAVAATLGRGECENVSMHWGEFECSACGMWADFGSDLHRVRVCPNCGKAVRNG